MSDIYLSNGTYLDGGIGPNAIESMTTPLRRTNMAFTGMDKGRPGVFFMFAEAAQERLSPIDGLTALLATGYGTPAVAGETYTFESRSAAKDGLGAVSTAYEAAKKAFDGGATRVIVRTLPATPLVADYEAAQLALAVDRFDAITFDHIPAADALTSMATWLENERIDNERYIFMVTGGDAARDADADLGIAAVLAHRDEFIVNVLNTPKFADATFTSAEWAPYVAGQLASMSLAGSLTFSRVDGAIDVSKRHTPVDIKAILVAGGFVYEYNGELVRSVRGLATDGAKLRKSLLKQAMATDIKRLVENNWIGKKANGPNQRLALEGVIGAYIDTLVKVEILDPEFTVSVTKPDGSADDQVAVAVSVKFYDTMEEVYVTVGFRA